MARRKRKSPGDADSGQGQSARRRAANITAPTTRSASKPAEAAETAARGSWKLWLLLIPILAFLAFAYLRYQQRPLPIPPGAQGNVLDCRQLPSWLNQRARSQGSALSTSEARQMGLVLIDPQAPSYQHPSWTRAGNLGSMVFDRRGYVFLIPVPKVNLLDNRPEAQNTLWRVDAINEELSPYLKVDGAYPPDVTNPFGMLGLTYDCETDLLYVSSVQGSTRSEERGEIHVISAAEPRLLKSHALGDFMGMGIFRGRSGKRIYMARARSSEVLSFPLAADGSIRNEPRSEFSLAGLGPRGDDTARRLTATGTDRLTAYGVEFSFNLVAPTEKKETRYEYRYQVEDDRFILRQIGQVPIQEPPGSTTP